MEKKNIYLFMALSALLLACEQIVDVDIPEHEPKLVVNSVMTPDSVFTFYISTSRGITDPFGSFIGVNNASINIYKNGQLIEQMTNGNNGTYKSALLKPQPGITYSMEASAAGVKPVASIETIPHQVIIEEIDVDMSRPVTRDDMTYFPISITITDPINVENFYFLEVFTIMGIKGSDSDPYYSEEAYVRLDVTSDDPLVQQESGFADNGLVITDITFDGKQHQIKALVNIFHYNLNIKEDDFSYKNVLLVSLKSFSPSYYRYFKTRGTQMDTDGNPLAEPVPVFNNIENGYGIFGSYTFEYRRKRFK